MKRPEGSVQDAVKSACSITYVSEKLGVSRPTLYKYMDIYDSTGADGLPVEVGRFFDFITSMPRTEEEVILFFMGKFVTDPGRIVEDTAGRIRVLTSPGRAMVLFPDSDPGNTSVRVYIDIDGTLCMIGEYTPAESRRFVTIDDLVSGQPFVCEVMSDGTSLGFMGFEIEGRCFDIPGRCDDVIGGSGYDGIRSDR